MENTLQSRRREREKGRRRREAHARRGHILETHKTYKITQYTLYHLRDKYK